MSPARKHEPLTELEQLEEALVESILCMSETELQDEIRDAGEDPDLVVRDFEALLIAAKTSLALQRLREAQESMKVFGQAHVAVSDIERAAARQKLDANQSTNDAQLLMAARKGKGASERDVEGLIDDFAELIRLEEGAADNDAS